MVDFTYRPDGETIVGFMSDPSFVRGLQGPIGSGKSVACVAESLRLMLGQERNFDPETVRQVGRRFTGERTGPRRLRIGVIRNTTPQLETTTMKTWLEWMPEDEFGKVRWRPPFKQDIRIPEIGLEAEVWFLALDRDEDVRKLLSFEFTFIWINEAREISRNIVSAAASRVRRYPRWIDGGPTRACLIMDTNAPDEEHWWSIMSGQADPPSWMSADDRLTLVKPDNWSFFVQPPAVEDVYASDGSLQGYKLNPERENSLYTDDAYYQNLMSGQSRDWITNMLQNRIGRSFSGRPVYRGVNENVHIAKEAFGPVEHEPIHIGVDFGLTPAACFGQDVRGQIRVFDELVTRETDAVTFARLLRAKISSKYPNHKIILTGDPRGEDRATTDSNTPFKVFAAAGLHIQPAWTNDPIIRVGAVQERINTMVEGAPAYLLSPNCTFLMAAKKGGYCYRKDAEEIDKKTIYSHISDGEQYMILRMGYGKQLVGRNPGSRLSTQANMRQNVFNRGGGIAARRNSRSTILSGG